MKNIFTIIIAGLLTGCVHTLDKNISEYHRVSRLISLNDSKEYVLSILEPTQPKKTSYRKAMESYLEGEDVIEIYYARSLRQPDGLTTDDEFTPYKFQNGKLIAIGWETLKVTKTQGQTSDSQTTIVQPAPIIIY
ncbi:MAG: hypothetical protein CBE26_04290 [Kiritimatiellaceae bacterium TMED266]|nr:MAG: hypothetical protein CBE26_04290 [Kiritimatiellaceae bacterium TMED266]